MLIEPHCSAMCWQQFRSASVISAPGIRHAIAGRPSKAISSRTLASWRTVFTYQVVYAQFGGTANLSAITLGHIVGCARRSVQHDPSTDRLRVIARDGPRKITIC